jgi:aryl-alcohol dehydrogenase-like predicted oxidoreductase
MTGAFKQQRDAMQYTTLGRTGLKVSVAGLGCGGNSRIGLGKLTEDQSVALVREAMDLGVNFIDTAENYETEGIVGKAIKGRPRDSVVISTKSLLGSGAGPKSGADMVACLDASLRKLDTDYVDIFHLHGLSPNGRGGAGAAAPEGEGQVPSPRRIGDRAARPRAQDAGAGG